MGTWIKQTDKAIYLMQGGYYISKISKYPSKSNPNEKVLNISGMKSWFSRADAPRGMTVSQTGPEPKPIPQQPAPSSGNQSSSTSRQTNASGVHLIKSFEGLRLKAYQDAVGVWTIGYGTTRGVKPGQEISEAQAEALLKADLNRFEQAVNQAVRSCHLPITWALEPCVAPRYYANSTAVISMAQPMNFHAGIAQVVVF